MKKNKWNDKEIKKLFLTVENAKSENKSLVEAFSIFAKKSKRKPNSVRNFYYQEVANLIKDSKKANLLGIDLNKHEVVNSTKFSIEETKNLVKEILRKKCMGCSVRKACFELANNDVMKMVRIQNKFRNVLQNEKDLYEECLQEIKKEGLYDVKLKREGSANKVSDKNANVVYLKRQEDKRLSDEDINSLFMGLVKLVKRTAFESAEKQFFSENQHEKENFRKVVSKLNNAEKTIENLKMENETIKKRSKALFDENINLKTRLAQFMSEKIIKTSKNKTLTNYLREIKEKGQDVKTKI